MMAATVCLGLSDGIWWRLKKGIDEWSERSAAPQYDKQGKQHDEDHERNQPPLLSFFEEKPEIP